MKRYILAVAHALLGWVFCAAVMGTALALTTELRAMIIHLAAAPFLAAGITLLYRRWPYPLKSLAWSVLFLGVIAGMDAIVVAGIILGSFEMFASPLGTWIPFAVLFLTAYGTARIASS